MVDYFSTTTPMHDIISVIYEECFNYYITVNYKLYLVYVTGMKKLISICCIDTNGTDVSYGHPYDCFPMSSMYVYVYIYIYNCVTYASMRCIHS